MSNHVKTNPIGLDAVIHDIQKEVYKLSEAGSWNVTMEGFPRCYILQNETKQKTIEAFLENTDYSGTLIFGEGNKFFFVAPNDIIKESGNYYTTELEMFVIVNVKECKPSITHRADEEVRADVLAALNRIPAVKVNKVVINIDRVFNRYNSRISQSYEYEYTDDMQPYHCFKVEMAVLPYNLNQTSCN